MAQRVRKAVLPVAGLGTRFLPATKAMPKEMLTVVDRPLIQYAVEECLAAGIEEFVFVTGRNKGAHRGSFRRRLRAGGDARAARQDARAEADRRTPPSSRATRSSPASRSRSASAMPCGAPATGSAASRSPCCCPTSSRSTRQLHGAARGGPRQDRRQRRRGHGRAARADQELRHRRGEGRRRTGWPRSPAWSRSPSPRRRPRRWR